jgi:hypothetical protein
VASLWANLNKGKVKYMKDVFAPDEINHIIRDITQTAKPKLVNITEQADEWVKDLTKDMPDPSQIDITPPFPRLWFEWQQNGNRRAVLVGRNTIPEMIAWEKYLRLERGDPEPPDRGTPPDHVAYRFSALVWFEVEGAVALRGGFDGFIDKLGRPLDQGKKVTCKDAEDENVIYSHLGFIADVLTTMNTRGTQVVPQSHQPTQVVKPNRAPCSVWHTIKIPKFRNPPLVGAVVSPEVLERREHWVRGHRRDYRHGGGMFGRIKALVWVPEYQRGNPELGTVQQTYEVRARITDEATK